MALLAFSIMIVTKKVNPRLPNVLIAVVITTVLSWVIGFQQLQTINHAQIASTGIQQQVQAQLDMRGKFEELSTQILAADKSYQQIIKDTSPNSLLTLEARYQLENLKLQRSQLKNDMKTSLKKLQTEELHFVAAANAEVKASADDANIKQINGKLYNQADLPENAEAAAWKVHKIDAEGNLLMLSGGKVVGMIPSGLPAFKMPSFDFSTMLQLLSTAIVISLIGFMEAISIAKAMAAKTRQKLDANQELIGQGMGNIMGGLFQSYPTSGSFSRSAVNISAGAITGFSAVVTSIVVIITLLWLTPLLYHLPQATLAAVIMMAVIGLVNVEAIKHAWHANKHDGSVSIITFVLTLAFAPHLDKGIMIGVILSLMMFLFRRMAPRVLFLRRGENKAYEVIENCKDCEDEKVGVLRFEGSLYFANISYFEEKVQELLVNRPKLSYLIVEGVSINEVDASGEEMLRAVVHSLNDANVEVLFSRVKTPVRNMLEHTGFIAMHGEDKFFRRPEQAFAYIEAQEEAAEAGAA